MFKKVKQWLGIEGVKIEVMVPTEVKQSEGAVMGQIQFQSQQNQIVDKVDFKIIEKYTRGSENEKLIDEYLIGSWVLYGPIDVPAQSIIEMNFSVPFSIERSRMDELEDKNILFSGIVKIAKKLRRVKSDYRIEAVASINGTALNPFSVKKFELIR